MAFSVTNRQLSSRHWTITVTWELHTCLPSTVTASLKSRSFISATNTSTSAGNSFFFLKWHHVFPLNCSSSIVCQNSIKNWKRTIKLQNWALWNLKFHNFNSTVLTKFHFLSTANISIKRNKCYFAFCTITSKDQILKCSKVTVGHQAINNTVQITTFYNPVLST